MEEKIVPIGIDEVFSFSCGKSVPCFNECCQDLNQFLTPYDILRLKNCLHMTSTDFLEAYTMQHTGPETGLPVITLKPTDQTRLVCPFVTEDGCRVYPDRPGSCRIYPLARMISRSRETGAVTEHWALLQEPHCKGFFQDRKTTVRDWIQSQGLADYNEMNDLLMEIISLKNQRAPGPLDFKSARAFHMACYDLDSFREKVFDTGEFESADFDDAILRKAKEDDGALLKVSLGWLKKMLFGETVDK